MIADAGGAKATIAGIWFVGYPIVVTWPARPRTYVPCVTVACAVFAACATSLG